MLHLGWHSCAHKKICEWNASYHRIWFTPEQIQHPVMHSTIQFTDMGQGKCKFYIFIYSLNMQQKATSAMTN